MSGVERITDTDLGKRVRITTVHEGVVSEVSGDYFTLTHDDGTRMTGRTDTQYLSRVERIRPAVPTGLGAVVRLDGGGIACRCSQSGSDPWWYMPGVGLSNCPQSDDYIGGRLAEVIHQGVTP